MLSTTRGQADKPNALTAAIAALLCVTGFAAQAQATAGAPSQDPAACAVLAADSRLATKFTAAGRSLCSQAAPALTAAPPIDVKSALGFEPAGPRTAQQLYLYSQPPSAITDSASPTPAAASTRRAVPRLQPGTTTPRKQLQSNAPDNVRRALALSPAIDAAARTHDIDPLLLHAIARVESRHNTQAVSHAGARGVMQVMPMTGRRFGVERTSELHHPVTNINVSATYLKTLQRRFGNNLPLVLAAYNAGEGAVERYGRRIPPFAETQGYVRQVLAEYALLRRASRHAANERQGDAS